jgi:hypothetical protein
MMTGGTTGDGWGCYGGFLGRGQEWYIVVEDEWLSDRRM